MLCCSGRARKPDRGSGILALLRSRERNCQNPRPGAICVLGNEVQVPGATVVMRVKSKSIMKLAGALHKKGRKPVSVEQMSR